MLMIVTYPFRFQSLHSFSRTRSSTSLNWYHETVTACNANSLQIIGPKSWTVWFSWPSRARSIRSEISDSLERVVRTLVIVKQTIFMCIFTSNNLIEALLQKYWGGKSFCSQSSTINLCTLGAIIIMMVAITMMSCSSIILFKAIWD